MELHLMSVCWPEFNIILPLPSIGSTITKLDCVEDAAGVVVDEFTAVGAHDGIVCSSDKYAASRPEDHRFT